MGIFDPDPYGGVAPWAEAAMQLGAGLMAGGSPGGGGLMGVAPAFQNIARAGRQRQQAGRLARAEERAEEMFDWQKRTAAQEAESKLREGQQKWRTQKAMFEMMGMDPGLAGPMPGGQTAAKESGQTVPIPAGMKGAPAMDPSAGIVYDENLVAGATPQVPMGPQGPQAGPFANVPPHVQQMAAVAAMSGDPMDPIRVLQGYKPPREYEVLTQEQEEALGLDTDQQYRREILPSGQGKVEPIGSRGVNVNVEAPKPPVETSEAMKVMGKKDATRVADLITKADTLRALDYEFDAVEAALDNFETGALGDSRLAFARLGNLLGVDNAETLAAGELIQSIQSRLAPQMRATGSGSTSDFDARQLLQSLPGLSKTVAGNKYIIGNMRRIANRVDKEAQYMREYLEENGSLRGFSMEKMNEDLGPIFSEDEKAFFEKVRENPRIMEIRDMTPEQLFAIDPDSITPEEDIEIFNRLQELNVGAGAADG